MGDTQLPSNERLPFVDPPQQHACYEVLPRMITSSSVGKHRRGGFVFITWKSNHPPRHVHVYRDGKLVVKWDLDNGKAMKGAATHRALELIAELESEGVL